MISPDYAHANYMDYLNLSSLYNCITTYLQFEPTSCTRTRNSGYHARDLGSKSVICTKNHSIFILILLNVIVLSKLIKKLVEK